MHEPLDYLQSHRADAIERMSELLSIPSVSTDPAYREDIEKAAKRASDQLDELGLEARVRPVEGKSAGRGEDAGPAAPPVVLARTTDAQVENPRAPRVLFYGHYDVQPPDPLERWTTPPFEPTVREGAIYARGACDDKGQVCCFLEALRAWKQTRGKLPGPVTVLLEGEEECGSAHLESFVAEHADELASDVVVISDTSMWESATGTSTPALTYGLRGLVYYDLKLHGPSRDLHSGVYGGAVANPTNVLVDLLGNLLDADHRVNVPGFYDDVAPLNPQEQEQWSQLGFDAPGFLREVGVSQPIGEASYTTLQRRWARPSCDINGLYGGYGGEGAKTVIPASAGAKVSFRLVPRQDAGAVARAFESWLASRDTRGCRLEATRLGEADPVMVPLDSPWISAAQRAIRGACGMSPVLVRGGGTIPVVAWLKEHLGLDSLLMGFGLESDQVHAPDEHLGLDRFALGCRSHVALLAELAQGQ